MDVHAHIFGHVGVPVTSNMSFTFPSQNECGCAGGTRLCVYDLGAEYVLCV